MSLATTQAAIDIAMSTLLSNIDSAQAAYYAAHGKYWQGLISHLTVPDSGVSIEANNLSATPTDQDVTWDAFMGANKPGTIPASVTVDVYQTPTGEWGYVKRVLFVYGGGVYSTATDSGENPANNVPWGSTPDAQAPPYLSSVASAIVGSGSDVSGVGTLAWSNPGNITQNDGSYASMDMAGVAATSHWLLGKSLGFVFPTNTVIDGIKATVRRKASSTASHDYLQDQTVKLFLSGAAIGSNKAAAGHIPTSIESKVYGGATDFWGANLTPDNLSDSSFGLGVSWSGEEANGQVDYIQFDVSYTSDATRAFPTITSLDVSSGTPSGGTAVTITGTGFKNGVGVKFGTDSATSILVVSSTSITCVTPAHSAGTVDVVVTNADSKAATLSNGYTFATPAPSYRQYNSQTGTNSGGITFSFASTPIQNNLMIVVLTSNSGVAWSSPAGWTQLQSGYTGAQVFYKIAGASESNAYNFDDGGSSKSDAQAGVMIEISNSGASSPIDASAATDSTYVSPSVTTTQANDVVLSLACGGVGTFTGAPSGWNLVATVSSGLIVAAAAYKSFASAGATGTATWTSSSGLKVFTVAVKG